MEQEIASQLVQRTVGIQQVMSRFPTVFKQPLYQLKSHDFYYEWNMNVAGQLNQMGYGLGQYFLTSDLSLPLENINLEDQIVVNLRSALENAMTDVTSICVDPAISGQYIFDTHTGGTALLQRIRTECENPSNRQIAQLLKEICYWTSVGCDNTDARVRACLRKLIFLSNRDPFVNFHRTRLKQLSYLFILFIYLL